VGSEPGREEQVHVIMANVTVDRNPVDLLDAALDLAGRGWHVFSLHDVEGERCSCGKADCKQPGKHPRTVHGLKDGTTEAATLRGWWTRWPTANVGVCTGPESGVWMLGPDGQAGIDALAELVRKYAPLPRTPSAKSGSGGRHYLFRWPAGGDIRNRRNHRGLPIDVRGAGGYFVAAPSCNRNGPYVWEVRPSECELADAPEWLLAWCRSAGEKSNPLKGPASQGASIIDRAVKYLAEVPPAVSGQGGHAQTLAAARAVVWGFDLGAEAGFQLLAQHYNPRCVPEWTEKELRHKCEEAATVSFGKERGWLLTETRRPATPSKPAATGRPPVVRTLPTYQPFPLDALPPTLREYVDAAAAAIGCDPALVALPALAVIAGCIGNSRAIQLRRRWSEPAVVWALTVARSGGVKSPAFSAAVDPLMDHQMGRHEDYLERKKEDDEAKLPPCLVTSNTTIESVGELLRDNPRGLLMARDELDGWFQSFTKYRQGGASDRPDWLELNRAGTLRLDRITRQRGPLCVRRAACSVCGTIQRGPLARALDAEALGAGLGARFLLAMPPMLKRVWTEAEVSEDLADNYAGLLCRLLALELADVKRRQPHFLGLSPPAKAAFVEWFNYWGELQHGAPDARAAVLAKLEGYAARLALLHSVVAHAAAEADDRRRPIGEQSIRAGIRLAEWFAAESERVYAALRESEDERSRRELVEWIAARDGETTAKAVQENLRSRYPTSEEARAALDELAATGLGDWHEGTSGPRGGRPSLRFRLRAHETTKPPEMRENSPELQGGDGFRGFVGAELHNGEAHPPDAPRRREPGEEG